MVCLCIRLCMKSTRSDRVLLRAQHSIRKDPQTGLRGFLYSKMPLHLKSLKKERKTPFFDSLYHRYSAKLMHPLAILEYFKDLPPVFSQTPNHGKWSKLFLKLELRSPVQAYWSPWASSLFLVSFWSANHVRLSVQLLTSSSETWIFREVLFVFRCLSIEQQTSELTCPQQIFEDVKHLENV